MAKLSAAVIVYSQNYGHCEGLKTKEITEKICKAGLIQIYKNSPQEISQNEKIPPIDKEGFYLDAWGNRFEIRVNAAGTRMYIRSSGPDGKPWTADDIIAYFYLTKSLSPQLYKFLYKSSY